jgi:cell wall-associated NlpC family hydrolase
MEPRPIRALLAALAAVLVIAAAPTQAAAVDEPELIRTIARTTLGAPFQLGQEGPTRFDCSGLVWYVFDTAGLGDRIGGKRMRARGYQKWFRDRGLLDDSAPRVGDIVFYGSPARHTGIVTGFNARGTAIVTSALTSGVKEHRYNRLDVRFHSFGHAGLEVRTDPPPEPTPTPSPAPTPAP